MTPATQGTIKRALAVLEEGLLAQSKMQTKSVALALWVLRGHCPEDWLKMYWEAAGVDHEIGRYQSMNAAFNGIQRRVNASNRGG